MSEEQIRQHFFGQGLEQLPISDWQNPSRQDLELIEGFVKNRNDRVVATPEHERLGLENYGWFTYRMGRLRMSHPEREPELVVDFLGNDPQKKDKCVICFAGYMHDKATDRDYTRGIERIRQGLKEAFFDGHFIYRVGAWPSLGRERLKWADVPYAFKPFMFEEAYDMGYSKIVWIDTACAPVRCINPLFDFLQDHGCCYFNEAPDLMATPEQYRQRGYLSLMASMNLQVQQFMPSLTTQVVGINIQNDKGHHLLHRWVDAAKAKTPFLESDQPPFALLVADIGLRDCALPQRYFVEMSNGDTTSHRQNPSVLIVHNYSLLNPEVTFPSDFQRL